MISLPPQFHLGPVDTGALVILTGSTQGRGRERETEKMNKYDKANKVGGERERK